MPKEGRGFDQPPLFGAGGRIPTAQAVTLTRQAGLAALRNGWLHRHTVAMVTLSPLLFVAYNAALGLGFDDSLWSWLTAVMSLVAALILTEPHGVRGLLAFVGKEFDAVASAAGRGVMTSLRERRLRRGARTLCDVAMVSSSPTAVSYTHLTLPTSDLV